MYATKYFPCQNNISNIPLHDFKNVLLNNVMKLQFKSWRRNRASTLLENPVKTFCSLMVSCWHVNFKYASFTYNLIFCLQFHDSWWHSLVEFLRIQTNKQTFHTLYDFMQTRMNKNQGTWQVIQTKFMKISVKISWFPGFFLLLIFERSRLSAFSENF